MTTKHKNISTQANLLLSKVSNQQKCFRLDDAYNFMPLSNPLSVRKLLSEMTERGLLMRLKAGLYHVIPFEEDPNSYMPEWHGITSCLVEKAENYVGYYSALQIHGLITQPSLKEQIVVAEQQKPSELTIRKVIFQFIYHNPTHFFGWTSKWVDPYQKIRCSDLEKTIIDCLFQPEYAGGIVEIAKALYTCHHQLNYPRLIMYIDQFKSQAVLKRLGFLLELMNINTTITEDLRKQKSSSYILLDPSLPKAGKYISRWSIQQNLDSDTIKSAINT